MRAASTIFMWVGLFTISWDRFLNISIDGYNVKVGTAAFLVAFFLTVADSFVVRAERPQRQKIVISALTVVFVFAVMSLFALDRAAAFNQIVVILLGAFIPLVTVYWNLRLFPQHDQALTALIRGGFVASIFGLYQLAAFYAGIPQGVSYTATSGGLGRISSFSYEAGYFGYFLILVIAAMYARSELRGEPVSRSQLVFLVVVLLLANSRATFLTLPLLFVLLYFRWPSHRKRSRIWPIAVAGSYIVALIFLAIPRLFTSLSTRVLSLFDPNEVTSNAPRLRGISLALRIIHDHLLVGIGPGNLIRYEPLYGAAVSADSTPNSVIANNIWLQALLDGGIPLLIVEVALVAVAVSTLFRRALPAARTLMAGWISVFIVSSLITSFYFDVKLWVTLGLVAAIASRELASRPSSRRTSAPAAASTARGIGAARNSSHGTVGCAGSQNRQDRPRGEEGLQLRDSRRN